MTSFDTRALAAEIREAHVARRHDLVSPSSREAGFSLEHAYEVGGQLRAWRLEQGRLVVGRKVGYANKAMWRALKLDTLVWAPMYDDTVIDAHGQPASLSMDRLVVPKIEPEVVFKLRSTPSESTDAVDILRHVEWIALGFEIIDCTYSDWKFTPADFVADAGLHAGLIVGEPLALTAERLEDVAAQLATFTLALTKDGVAQAEGSGKNSLRSPALCLGELARAASRRGDELRPGELISSGTLTEAQRISLGDRWAAVVDGLPMAAPTVVCQ